MNTCEQIKADLARRRRLISEERQRWGRLEQQFGAELDAMDPEQIRSALVATYGTLGGEFEFRRTNGRPKAWVERLPLLEFIEAKTVNTVI